MTNFLLEVSRTELISLQTSLEAWINFLSDLYKKEQHKETKFSIKQDINTAESVKARVDILLLQVLVSKRNRRSK